MRLSITLAYELYLNNQEYTGEFVDHKPRLLKKIYVNKEKITIDHKKIKNRNYLQTIFYKYNIVIIDIVIRFLRNHFFLSSIMNFLNNS